MSKKYENIYRFRITRSGNLTHKTLHLEFFHLGFKMAIGFDTTKFYSASEILSGADNFIWIHCNPFQTISQKLKLIFSGSKLKNWKSDCCFHIPDTRNLSICPRNRAIARLLTRMLSRSSDKQKSRHSLA